MTRSFFSELSWNSDKYYSIGQLKGKSCNQLKKIQFGPTCHAKGAPYAVKIRQAKGKPVTEVAAWIRNPQSKVPGTPMPTFATLLTEEQSEQLATWLLARLDEPAYRF